MKQFLSSILLSVCVFFAGCEITPEIISQKRPCPQGAQPSQAKQTNTNTNGEAPIVVDNDKEFGYGWVLWYIPILLIAVGWGYREFIKPRKAINKKVRRRS